MRAYQATAVLVAALVLTAGLAQAVNTNGGMASRVGGPNEHANQDMTAKSIALTTATGNMAVCVDGSTCSYGLFQNASNQFNAKAGGTNVMVFQSGSMTAQVALNSNVGSGTNAFGVSVNGARVDFGTGASDHASSDGTTVTFAGPIRSSGTQTAGTITLSSGTGTATVISGAKCVCTDTTGTNAVKCAVSSTTLTATGTGTDVIAYLCL